MEFRTVFANAVRNLRFQAGAAIDAKPPFCYHSKRSRGRNPLNPREAPFLRVAVPYKVACRDLRPMVGRGLRPRRRSGTSERRSRIEP